MPTEYRLYQSYPNPFNPSATIQFSLPRSGNVKLTIFDILGRQLATLLDERREAGDHSLVWNASGRSSGIYFYRLEVTSVSDSGKSFTQVKKMMLLK